MSKRTALTVTVWSLAGIGATALLLGTGTRDPAAPDYAFEDSPAVVCEAGQTLNMTGDGCVPLTVTFYEDGSWHDHTTGTFGCTPGALCDPRNDH